MRNMIFKTLFASILGSLFIAPLAHADRQGGGTLRAAFVLDPVLIEGAGIQFDGAEILYKREPATWVKFKSAKGDSVTFDYSWMTAQESGQIELTATRTDLVGGFRDLASAILKSKNVKDWQPVNPSAL